MPRPGTAPSHFHPTVHVLSRQGMTVLRVSPREWQVDTRELVRTYYQGPVIPQCVAYGSGWEIPGCRHERCRDRIVQRLWPTTVAVGRCCGRDKVDGMVYDVAFSHDGKWLAAAIGATLKGEARMWVCGDRRSHRRSADAPQPGVRGRVQPGRQVHPDRESGSLGALVGSLERPDAGPSAVARTRGLATSRSCPVRPRTRGSRWAWFLSATTLRVCGTWPLGTPATG